MRANLRTPVRGPELPRMQVPWKYEVVWQGEEKRGEARRQEEKKEFAGRFNRGTVDFHEWTCQRSVEADLTQVEGLGVMAFLKEEGIAAGAGAMEDNDAIRREGGTAIIGTETHGTKREVEGAQVEEEAERAVGVAAGASLTSSKG